MLGQGDNSDIKTPIPPVELPDGVRKLIDDHQSPPGYGEGQPSVWLFTSKGYHFDKEKPLRRTWHRKVRILTTQGANEFSSIEHPFHPLHERIFINKVSVQNENGEITSPANILEDAYVMDLVDGNASHRKKLHFQVPGLRPGSILEYQITVEDMSPSEQFPFTRNTFSDSAADIVFVTGDALDKIKSEGLRLDGTTKVLEEENFRAWVALDTPIFQYEPNSTMYEDRVPMVVLAGIEGTWEKVGADYLEEIRDRLKVEPETKELARQLTEGAKSDEEKVARLARYVQKEISYTALEFGVRALRPNPALQTINQKYGDCKDQALLLHQLLSASEVESHLALVSTSRRTWPGLPSLDQFNHMVVHVPCLGEGRLVDTTQAHLQLEKWQPDDLWHSHALILETGKSRLIPPQEGPSPDSCIVESQRTVKAIHNKDWEVHEILTVHGYYAAWLRGAFAGLDKSGILQKSQSLMEKQARVQIHEALFESLDDPSKHAVLELRYVITDAIQSDGGGFLASLPAVWENDYLAVAYVKDRQTPLEFRYPLRMRSKMAFEGVPGEFVTALKALEKHSKGAYASHEIRLDTSDPATPVLEFDFSALPTSQPATEYGRWYEEWSRSRRDMARQVAWKE